MSKAATKSKHIKKTIWIADTSAVVRIGLRDIVSSVGKKAAITEISSFDELIRETGKDIFNRKLYYIGDTKLSAETGIIDIIRKVVKAGQEAHFLFFTDLDIRIFETLAFEPLVMAKIDCEFISKNDRDFREKISTWLLSRMEHKRNLTEQSETSQAMEQTAFDRYTCLSTQEIKVLKGLIGGKTRAQIAHKLKIKYPTVITYIDRIYRKMGVKTLRDAVMITTELGGIENIAVYSRMA